MATPFLLSDAPAGSPAPSLVGSWQDPDGDLRLTCYLGGGFVLSREGEDGARQTLRGEYLLDTSKRPAVLSLRRISGLDHALFASVEFEGDGTLHVSPFSPSWRLRPLTVRGPGSVALERDWGGGPLSPQPREDE